MVITIATGAYSLFTTNWGGNVNNYQQTTSKAKNLRLLRNTLISVVPYIYRKDDNVPSYFFEGKSDNLQAVTEHSISDPKYPALFQLNVSSPMDDEKFVLTYQEYSLKYSWLNHPSNNNNWSEPVILFESEFPINLSYYGWRSKQFELLFLENSDDKSRYQEWTHDYNSSEKNTYPELIKITIANKQNTELLFKTNQYDTIRMAKYEENQ